MHSPKYLQYEKQYNEFKQRAFECSSNDLAKKIVCNQMGESLPEDPEHDEYIYDQVFLYNSMALLSLAYMFLTEPEDFEYYSEMDKTLNWFIDRMHTRAIKGYDQYILTQILLDDKSFSLWDDKFRKNFKFLLRKIHNMGNIMYWTIRFNSIAIDDGLYNLSNHIISNAIYILEDFDSFTSAMKSKLESKYIEI